MKRPHKTSDRTKFIGETKAKQRNVVWPDFLINSRSVDAFLLRGSPSPTLVQRIGAWLFGITFMGLGIAFLILASHEGAWLLGLLVIGLFGLGVRIFYNGCRTRKPKAEVISGQFRNRNGGRGRQYRPGGWRRAVCRLICQSGRAVIQ